MSLAELLQQYRAARMALPPSHPDVEQYDVLIANVEQMIKEFKDARRD